MARLQTGNGMAPEEDLVAGALREIFEGVLVSRNDDESEDGMFDLRLDGPFRGGVEVGQVTDPKIRQANG